MYSCRYMHMGSGACRDNKKVSDPHGMGAIGSCEPTAQCGCWTPNLGTRQEQYVLCSSEHHSSLRRTILELRVCQ